MSGLASVPASHRPIDPRARPLLRAGLAGLALALLQGCTLPARWLGATPAAPGQPAATAAAAGPAAAASAAPRALAVTAHPLASAAAVEMLARGGSAADAAVAAQMVLGLVEPQSSGLGGGALALHWDAATRQLSSLDGLSTAPGRATAAPNIDTDGRALPAEQVRRGGRSVGAPGALALLEQLHQRHGRLPWAQLFEPAIRAAEQGFAMPPYLHSLLAGAGAAREHAEFALYFDPQGQVLPVGTLMRHPGYARTMRMLAQLGPRGWLLAGAAREIAATAQRGAVPGLLAESDLLAYRAEPREPLCAPRLAHTVCVMGPSSFGGMAVLQMLGVLEQAQPGGAAAWRFDDAGFVHRFAEAGRLSYADRLHHAADPGFVPVPARALVEPAYLAGRARLILPDRAAPPPPPGQPGAGASGPSTTRRDAHDVATAAAEHADATSQIAIIDPFGNALSITTTINLNFGARLMVADTPGSVAAGVVLNNVLTNFSAPPRPGQVRPNQMAPFKRAVTSMTPTIVFDAQGQPLIVGGSAGGAPIVDYVAQALIEMLAHGRSPAQALAVGHAAGGETLQLERGKPIAALAPALQAMGHRVSVTEMRSGLAFARRGPNGWEGAADPRRDGTALALP